MDESGTWEVYVQGMKGTGGKWQVSNGGGYHPLWAHNGREIYYQQGDRMMAVEFKAEPVFSPGTPKTLFTLPKQSSESPYDVSLDDQRFLMLQYQQPVAVSLINVTLNWFEKLKRLMPAGNKD